MEKYLNTNLSAEERASDLLSKMSLEERMAQVNCVLLPGGKEDNISEYCKYGIGEISTLEVRMLKTAKEAAEFQRKIQMTVMENSPHHIPAIFHMEGRPILESLEMSSTGASVWVNPAAFSCLATICPIFCSSSVSQEEARPIPEGKLVASWINAPHNPSIWKIAGM